MHVWAGEVSLFVLLCFAFSPAVSAVKGELQGFGYLINQAGNGLARTREGHQSTNSP